MHSADWVDVTSDPIDLIGAHQYLADPDASCGAHVVFVGCVRQFTDADNTGFDPRGQTATHQGRPVVRTKALFYECHWEMACRAMRQLLAESRQRWSLGRQVMLHRVGYLEIGQAAILIGVSSSHRQAAYAANQFLIDQVKQRVPVWKKEIFPDGDAKWIHGTPPGEQAK